MIDAVDIVEGFLVVFALILNIVDLRSGKNVFTFAGIGASVVSFITLFFSGLVTHFLLIGTFFLTILSANLPRDTRFDMRERKIFWGAITVAFAITLIMVEILFHVTDSFLFWAIQISSGDLVFTIQTLFKLLIITLIYCSMLMCSLFITKKMKARFTKSPERGSELFEIWNVLRSYIWVMLLGRALFSVYFISILLIFNAIQRIQYKKAALDVEDLFLDNVTNVSEYGMGRKYFYIGDAVFAPIGFESLAVATFYTVQAFSLSGGIMVLVFFSIGFSAYFSIFRKSTNRRFFAFLAICSLIAHLYFAIDFASSPIYSGFKRLAIINVGVIPPTLIPAYLFSFDILGLVGHWCICAAGIITTIQAWRKRVGLEITCKYCKKEISPLHKFCLYCGRKR